jgi:RHS repeat-associated protein
VRYNNLGQKSSAQYWIWLDGLPLAQIDFRYNTSGAVTSTNKYYLHSDHLNTPRLATSQTQTLLWSWDSDAFGLGTPNGDVDGDGVVVDIPLRFPGQIFEAYSNLNYNYFRDYDPNTGRYVQSDPIGLQGGLNTYSYVMGNPLAFTDILGLAPGDLFATADDAAIDAAAYARVKSDQSIEYGGWVYPVGSCWTYNFLTGVLPGPDDWWGGSLPEKELAETRPDGSRVIWHTHPNTGLLMHQENYSGDYLGKSPGDMSTSRNNDVGIYLNTPAGKNAYYDYNKNPDHPYREIKGNSEGCKCKK